MSLSIDVTKFHPNLCYLEEEESLSSLSTMTAAVEKRKVLPTAELSSEEERKRIAFFEMTKSADVDVSTETTAVASGEERYESSVQRRGAISQKRGDTY